MCKIVLAKIAFLFDIGAMILCRIDTESLSEQLCENGFSDEQAVAVIGVLRHHAMRDIVTQDDIHLLKAEIANHKMDLLIWIMPVLMMICILLLVKIAL